MSTNYPKSLDQLNNPSSSTENNDTVLGHSSQHTNLNDAVEAVENELGVAPKGTHSSVRARLDALETKLDTTIAGFGDHGYGVADVDDTINRMVGFGFTFGLTPNPSSQTLWATSYAPRHSFTVNYISFVTSSGYSFGPPTVSKLGIYQTDGTTYTLVGSTTNQPTTFTTANVRYKVPLTSPVDIHVGNMYYIAYLTVSTGSPANFYGTPILNAAVSTLPPKMSFTLPGQTDLPVTIADSAVTTNTNGCRAYYYLSNT